MSSSLSTIYECVEKKSMIIIVWCSFVLLGIVLKINELEKDNFADLFPFLTLSVRNFLFSTFKSKQQY